MRITSPAEVGQNAAIEARLAADGTLTLSVEGKMVATGKSSGPFTRQPQEPFCVGYDSANPVDSAYEGKARFTGEIRKLTVSTR